MKFENWRQEAARRVSDTLNKRQDGYSQADWREYCQEIKSVPYTLRRNGVVLGLALLEVRSAKAGRSDRQSALADVLTDLAALLMVEGERGEWITNLAAKSDQEQFRKKTREIHETVQILKQLSALWAVIPDRSLADRDVSEAADD